MRIRQQVLLYDGPHLFDNLADYWTQYWRVDDPNRDIPPAFQEFLETVQPMPEFQVEAKNLRLWQFAIDSQKLHSARGVDGISSAELQQLPPLALGHLCDIMADMSKFPAWIMVTLTVAFPKVPGEITASQVHPIILFAQLYRTWSRVVSQQVLAKFASFMPSNITGFLKHRGPMDASMMFAYFLEKAHNAGTAYSGMTLDLVKCFNTICRKSAMLIMHRLGIPAWLIDMWAGSRDCVQRRWTLNRQCSPLIETNNGCP